MDSRRDQLVILLGIRNRSIAKPGIQAIFGGD